MKVTSLRSINRGRFAVLLAAWFLTAAPLFAHDQTDRPAWLRGFLASIPPCEPDEPPPPLNPREHLNQRRRYHLSSARYAARKALEHYESADISGDQAFVDDARREAAEVRRHGEGADFVDTLIRDFNDGRLTAAEAMAFILHDVVPAGRTPPPFYLPESASVRCARAIRKADS